MVLWGILEEIRGHDVLYLPSLTLVCIGEEVLQHIEGIKHAGPAK